MMQRVRDPRREGFTLIELLVVVLIIGILAAIALPNFLGSRTKAKNAQTMAAVRNALVAARAYYAQGETFNGLTAATLNQNEGSISSTELAAGATVPVPGNNNPQQVWIGNGTDGTDPNAAGSPVVLCGSGKGDTVYCAYDNGSTTQYAKAVPGSAATAITPTAASGISWTGGNAGSPVGWSSSW